jgi:predicted nucleotidyltransferase
VRAAWLFGSRAAGQVHPSSDVDVAVLLSPGTPRDALSRLSSSLERALGMEADVVDIATSTPVLGFEIVAHGRRVFACDDGAAAAADDADARQIAARR